MHKMESMDFKIRTTPAPSSSTTWKLKLKVFLITITYSETLIFWKAF